MSSIFHGDFLENKIAGFYDKSVWLDKNQCVQIVFIPNQLYALYEIT